MVRATTASAANAVSVVAATVATVVTVPRVARVRVPRMTRMHPPPKRRMVARLPQRLARVAVRVPVATLVCHRKPVVKARMVMANADGVAAVAAAAVAVVTATAHQSMARMPSPVQLTMALHTAPRLRRSKPP